MTPAAPAGPAGLAALLATGPWPLDGGLASELEARGADISGSLWSARLLVEDPEAIVDVHAAYLRAGARVITSASYQASREGFLAVGLDGPAADRLLAASVGLARRAVAESGASGALVAASVGPYGAIRHDGSEYRGRYGVSPQVLVDFHRRRLDVLAAAGPDLLAVETIPDAAEAEALAEVLADHPGLPAWVCFSCGPGGRVSAGQPVEVAVAALAAVPSVLAVGVNCTAPEHVAEALRSAARGSARPLVAYPNAGRGWDPRTGWSGPGADRLPVEAVVSWADAGAVLIGGCCGLGPAAIAEVATTLAGLRGRPAPGTPR